MKLPFALLFLCSWSATIGPVAAAGSADAGRASFNTICSRCHVVGPTEALFVPARFDASYLTDAFRRVTAMIRNTTLLGGSQGVDDVATYLGLVGLGLPDITDTDRLLDWGEDTYPQLLSPARQPTQQLSGFSYRFYPATGVYVGTKDGNVWYYDGRTPGSAILNLGTLRSFLGQMPNGR